MQATVGEVVTGKVTGITDFGVFVDIGDGKKGMIHISEISKTYVSDINEHVKMGDTVKAKIISADGGKIALSIKQLEEAKKEPKPRKKPTQPAKPDLSYVWTKKSEPTDFEDMMSKFKQTSDEKFSDLKRKNFDTRRARRGTGNN